MLKQEPIRLSGVLLLENNLLDPVILISTSIIHLLCCITITSDITSIKYIISFTALCFLFNYHIESYRSFKRVQKLTHSLETNDKPALRSFLTGHLRYLKPGYVFDQPLAEVQDAFATRKPRIPNENKTACSQDTYKWVNKVILYFWPYLSHIVHHELNNFLANSRSLTRRDMKFRRLLYAVIKMIDANILAVERCELGSNAPYIRSIHVVNQRKGEADAHESLVYDLDLVYEGNMNISLICRYFCCCDSRLGLKDVFVHMSPRITVGPIDKQSPMIEKVSLSLLKFPKFGYKGIALVELTRLKIARRSLNRLIREHLLFPKNISWTYQDLLDNIKTKQAEKENVVQKNDRLKQIGFAESDQIPWATRWAARLMVCTCMCSNVCLRFCQEDRLNRDSQELLNRVESN